MCKQVKKKLLKGRQEHSFEFGVEGREFTRGKSFGTCLGRDHRRILHSSHYLLIGQRAGLIL